MPLHCHHEKIVIVDGELAFVGGIDLTSLAGDLPCLAVGKLRPSARLAARDLRSDGMLSAAGAALAGATLLSIVLEDAAGWWWADAVAALLIAALLATEGSRAVHFEVRTARASS
jgi:Phospholipase D Active site motif